MIWFTFAKVFFCVWCFVFFCLTKICQICKLSFQDKLVRLGGFWSDLEGHIKLLSFWGWLPRVVPPSKRPVSLKKSFRPQWCHDIMGFLSRMPEKTWENLGLQITANRIYTFICTSKICTWSRAYSFRNTWHCPGSSKRLLLVSSEWPRLTKVIDPLLSPSPHIPCFSSCLFCGRAFFRCFFSAAWNLVYFECFFTCVFLPKGFNWL